MRRLLLLFLVLLAACAAMAVVDHLDDPAKPTRRHFEAGPAQTPAHSMSIVALLADPERHHGQRVAVSGFLVLEFEHAALYLDRTSQEAGLQGNGIWIDPPLPIDNPGMKKLSRAYVVAEGTFNAKEQGYGAYAGTLQNIRVIEPTYTEQAYRKMQVRWSADALFMAVQSLLVYAALLTLVAMIGFALYRLLRRVWR